MWRPPPEASPKSGTLKLWVVEKVVPWVRVDEVLKLYNYTRRTKLMLFFFAQKMQMFRKVLNEMIEAD